jgi:hypothetical protein
MVYIPPGVSVGNDYIESVNNRLRKECHLGSVSAGWFLGVVATLP